MNAKIEQAKAEYEARQARRSHPDGKFDKQQRWYPAEDEIQPCCRRIRRPSRAWPYSLNRHCRSIEHVANLFGVDVKELRKACR